VIELWRQVIVLSSCFRLVRFRSVDRCTGNRSLFSTLRTYHRNESSGRSDWFVLHRICLNDEQRRAVTSAIEPPRASSLGGGALETTRVLSRAAERHHREQLLSSRLMRSRKPLFFGPKSHFNLQREKPDTDTSLGAVVGSGLADIITSRIRLPVPKRRRKSPWKEFPRLALPHPARICDTHVTHASRQLHGSSQEPQPEVRD